MTLLPALFMMTTTIFSLCYLLLKKDGYLATGNYALAFADLCLIVLAIGVVFVALGTIRNGWRVAPRYEGRGNACK